jgi:hypothetical protein
MEIMRCGGGKGQGSHHAELSATEHVDDEHALA